MLSYVNNLFLKVVWNLPNKHSLEHELFYGSFHPFYTIYFFSQVNDKQLINIGLSMNGNSENNFWFR